MQGRIQLARRLWAEALATPDWRRYPTVLLAAAGLALVWGVVVGPAEAVPWALLVGVQAALFLLAMRRLDQIGEDLTRHAEREAEETRALLRENAQAVKAVDASAERIEGMTRAMYRTMSPPDER